MANYCATIRTNYFSVKDEEKFREIMRSVSAEDEITIFEQATNDGKKFGFGCYGPIHGMLNTDEEYADIDGMLDALQTVILENDAIIIMEAGYEKLRYVTGFCTIITSSAIHTTDIHQQALELSRKILGNPDYGTQMDY